MSNQQNSSDQKNRVIAEIQTAINEGLNSGVASPLDMEAIKKKAQQRPNLLNKT